MYNYTCGSLYGNLISHCDIYYPSYMALQYRKKWRICTSTRSSAVHVYVLAITFRGLTLQCEFVGMTWSWRKFFLSHLSNSGPVGLFETCHVLVVHAYMHACMQLCHVIILAWSKFSLVCPQKQSTTEHIEESDDSTPNETHVNQNVENNNWWNTACTSNFFIHSVAPHWS